ncbi:hypothetical protein V6N12_062415 [Hibiscus sabdariffa]|uniref:RING-type E3 ubiquitin transferase (cysteine targeting) n=1 Tax=Hibiscus sabdariffa TaxID=183260 RepID=A0ABR2F8S9_9ROSI
MLKNGGRDFTVRYSMDSVLVVNEKRKKNVVCWRCGKVGHHSAMPISISRVNQLDAARLDIEMSAMLKEQLVKVFSLIKPGMLFQYEPELDAFLELLIWRFSIWVDKPTLEIALMNLRYQDEHAMEIRGKDKDWTSFSYCSTSNFGFH